MESEPSGMSSPRARRSTALGLAPVIPHYALNLRRYLGRNRLSGIRRRGRLADIATGTGFGFVQERRTAGTVLAAVLAHVVNVARPDPRIATFRDQGEAGQGDRGHVMPLARPEEREKR